MLSFLLHGTEIYAFKLTHLIVQARIFILCKIKTVYKRLLETFLLGFAVLEGWRGNVTFFSINREIQSSPAADCLVPCLITHSGCSMFRSFL